MVDAAASACMGVRCTVPAELGRFEMAPSVSVSASPLPTVDVLSRRIGGSLDGVMAGVALLRVLAKQVRECSRITDCFTSMPQPVHGV